MRPELDVYFLQMAQLVATRATCDRKKVGAVITIDGHVVSTGYNGAPTNLPHCDEVGHETSVVDGNETCVRTTHAEQNAVAIAAKYGRVVKGGTIFLTHAPCVTCTKTLVTAGIQRIVYMEDTKNGGLSLAVAAGLCFRQLRRIDSATQ